MNSKVLNLGVYYVVTKQKKEAEFNILIWKTDK